ncbi:DEAD/DEAH box helicase family protein [Brevibacterium aurantiacum]|uniref:DEAD/DEAH box helicase family protein n=1 Tax=Brevibacterium aurantiacum TaxID=273384 RepID=UPI00216330D1|nr:DEAD/DEAH box helicase family protein [Brevibacterium aurantiacum]
MVDFGALRSRERKGAPIEPRQLYGLLPNKARGRGQLWDAQAQALSDWHERREDTDLVIKLNTGGGKTAVGLVILQSILNANDGPALFVAPSNYLVEQAFKEAQALGIDVTKDVDGSAYIRGEAIGIVNIYKLVNGRSIFSSNRSAKQTAPIGSLVIDDAHAAIATSREQLSLELPSNSDAYKDLLELFRDSLHSVSPDGLLDIEDGVRSRPIPVPFWTWQEHVDEARKILRNESLDSDKHLYYSWPAVKDCLELGKIVFDSDRLTVTFPCPPISHITGLLEAHHKIFLTATLADDSVLVTDFGASAESVRDPITPVTAGDIGERMILTPQEINSEISTKSVRQEVAKLSEKYNTVVLVPSDKWAMQWSDFADVIADANSVEHVVDRLKSGAHVGLVVLANKYDGIDLPHDACRILVVDGLPENFSPGDRLQSILRGNDVGVDDRQIQRIEQGMGRGVRSNEDYCVVFLIGPKLSQLTVDPRSLPRFSPATRNQLQTSREVASVMENASLRNIVNTAHQALDRDPQWVEFAKERLGETEARSSAFSEHAVSEREAFDLARDGDCRGASELLSEAAKGLQTNKRIKGALLEQSAAYMNAIDRTLGQNILAEARTYNSYTLRPLTGITYKALDRDQPQVERCVRQISATYSSPAQLRLSVDSIIDDLAFDPERTEQFEEALFEAGRLIGVGSQRPEHDTGQGPDNLFALPGASFWVIEAKSGATSMGIGKRDLGQLGQSLLWFKRYYDPDAQIVPVMVHPSTKTYRDASAPEGTRIMTKMFLGKFTNALRKFAEGLAEFGWSDPNEVGRILVSNGLDATSMVDNFTTEQRGTI